MEEPCLQGARELSHFYINMYFIYLGIRTLFPECELMRVFQKYYLKELKLLRESGKLQYSGTLLLMLF